MNASFKNKIKTGILMASVLGLMATSASAFEIVRDSAGVLATGYVKHYLLSPVPPFQVLASYVIHTPTATLACSNNGYIAHCTGWVSGYTVTGNGYEVTKP